MRIKMRKIKHILAFNWKVMRKQEKNTNCDELEWTEINQIFLIFFVLNMLDNFLLQFFLKDFSFWVKVL